MPEGLAAYDPAERDNTQLMVSAHSLPQSVIDRGDAYRHDVAATMVPIAFTRDHIETRAGSPASLARLAIRPERSVAPLRGGQAIASPASVPLTAEQDAGRGGDGGDPHGASAPVSLAGFARSANAGRQLPSFCGRVARSVAMSERSLLINGSLVRRLGRVGPHPGVPPRYNSQTRAYTTLGTHQWAIRETTITKTLTKTLVAC